MPAANELRPLLGAKRACDQRGISRSSYYPWLRPPFEKGAVKRRIPDFGLTVEEREEVVQLLHSQEFLDMAPYEVYASLLDQGRYLCSIRTMYRILKAFHGQIKERRNQLTHPQYPRPELLATGPNQLWTWDITKLRGPATWSYFYLYVIIDVFTRYVTGWMLAYNEDAFLATDLITQACQKQNIKRD